MSEVSQEMLDEAYDRVYKGHQPEFPCKEHGHFDCAFSEGGLCSAESANRELERMLDEGWPIA